MGDNGMKLPDRRTAMAQTSFSTSSLTFSLAKMPLIKKVYEVDPLICPHCGGEMRFLAVIEEAPVTFTFSSFIKINSDNGWKLALSYPGNALCLE
jgi:hypothetical protein